MSRIQQITDEGTRDFAESCYNSNDMDDLTLALVSGPDRFDMNNNDLTAAQWTEAIEAALEDRTCYQVRVIADLNLEGWESLGRMVAAFQSQQEAVDWTYQNSTDYQHGLAVVCHDHGEIDFGDRVEDM